MIRPVNPIPTSGGTLSPLFGRPVNPIPTRGGTLSPPSTTCPPRFSDLATALGSGGCNLQDLLAPINEIFLPCHMHQNVRPVCHPHLSSTTAGTAVGSSTMPGTLHQTMASTPHLRLILTPMVAGRSPAGGPEGRVPTQFWADQLTLSQPAGAH